MVQAGGEALFIKVDVCVRNRTSCYILVSYSYSVLSNRQEVQKHKGNQYENCESLLINQRTNSPS